MKTALFAISVLIILAGCVSRNDKEIAEIRASLEKQNAEISALRAELDEFNKAPEKLAEIREEQMLDAAILLARNCPDKCSSQAIRILGNLGGEKAEAVLMDLAENSSGKKYWAVLDALENMKSKKLRGIILQELSNENSKHLRDIIHLLNRPSKKIIEKEDITVIEKLLRKFDDNSGRENNADIRNSLIRIIYGLDPEKGTKLACKILSKSSQSSGGKLIYCLTENNTSVNIASWIEIVKASGLAQENTDLWRTILERISYRNDWRVTDIILPQIEKIPPSSILIQNCINALSRLKDPKAAGMLLELYDKNEKFSSQKVNLNNYPGIKKDGNKYVLVDDETMKKLMEKRAKKIKYLNEIDKKAGN